MCLCFARLAALSLILTLSACQLAGPHTIKAGRGRYNVAIQQTNNEQLLLNLVRLRYRDTPYFLEVASVSSSMSLQVSGGFDATVPDSSPNVYGASAGAAVSEEPTVTYTPLQGEQFVKQLLTPVDNSTILLLYHSGWSVERLFRVCVQSLNGVPNAPKASGPTPEQAPKYERFLRAVRILRTLQTRGTLDLGQSSDPKRPGLVMRIDPDAIDSTEVAEITGLLGLEPGRTTYLLTQQVREGDGERVGMVVRSLMASFFYLSQAVEVPEDHEEASRVTVTRDEEGKRFDWQKLTGDLLQIHSSKNRPGNAYAAIRYRGVWFFIDDSDLDSKSTFALLAQLFALQAGSVPGMAPILTLPVSR